MRRESGVPWAGGRGSFERLAVAGSDGIEIVVGGHPPRDGVVPFDGCRGGAQPGPVEVASPMDSFRAFAPGALWSAADGWPSLQINAAQFSASSAAAMR